MSDTYETICIIGEIFNGYSELSVGDLSVFIKHPSLRDQRSIQRIYDEYYQKAIDRGIDSEKKCVERLVDDGLWVEEDELKISQLEQEINHMESSLRNIILPSQKKKTQEEISQQRLQVNGLLNKRMELIGLTAEYFASKRSNEEFIRTLIYKDEGLTKLMYSVDDFDEEDDIILKKVLELNRENSKRFEDENLQRIVLTGEFSLYLQHAICPSDFFGKPVVQLSVYQLKMSAYASLFDRIFKNIPDIPNNIRKDPAALLQFAENKSETNKSHMRKNDKGGATAVFGATKEDLDILDPEAKKVNLTQMIKDKGGSLTMEQMMEMM